MRIALGMSGGIDSSMCAMILREMGHTVIGITMAKWSPASGILTSDKRGCFGPSEPISLESAKKAAKKIGIENHVIDLEHEFRDCVLSYYTRDFEEGRTPNPCIICNREIKFGRLLSKSRELGISFDLFATGHYVRIAQHTVSQRYQLLKAIDSHKDQSYFLGMLSQDQLSTLYFPLGSMKKEEIKALARSKGFEYLEKKMESQDFLESFDNSPLFDKESVRPGDFVDINGKVLGRHQGLIRYTIGQRKGLGLAGFDSPRYVIGLDKAKNHVVIGKEEDLYRSSLITSGINWVSIPEPQTEFTCEAKVRLAQRPEPCLVRRLDGNRYQVEFQRPISAITPGQLLALYRNDLVLGAGFIES